ncbi:Tryptophan--tRNA ligase 2 [Burkholderia glumae]|nr:Tryptophan--tRNA ligase 2 [Burkholderia glumae]
MSELQANAAPLPVVLTGDRPTGPLHLGHSVGSLRTRLPRQDTRPPTILSADTQALTDNAHDPDKVRRHALDVALDYLAAGIDPARSRHASHARRGARRARYVLARHRERAARGRRARRLKRGLGHAAAARKPNPRSRAGGEGLSRAVAAGAPACRAYCAPSCLISASSWASSASSRSVSGARTGPASWPTSFAPAFTMLTA